MELGRGVRVDGVDKGGNREAKYESKSWIRNVEGEELVRKKSGAVTKLH